ncbi:TolC family protein [Myxococcota bacterium]|nr:TolC family protein [Myxococcota bacterium]
MKWTALFVTTLLASAPLAAAAQDAPPAVLGYRDVLEAVRKNNAALAAVRAGVDVADAEVSKAYTSWQPQLNAIGSVTFSSQKAELGFGELFGPLARIANRIETNFPGTVTPMDLAILNGVANAEPTVIQPHVSLAGVLALNQTLFNITALRAPDVAKAARRAAVAQVDAVEDELLFGAATLYATAGGLKALEAASDRALAVAEQRLRDAKVQLEAGTATPLVVTRAETDRTSAAVQKTTLQSRRSTLLANLRALVGAEGPVEVKEERLSDYVKEPKNDDAEQRSSVKARKAQVDAAEKAIGLSNMSWLPSVVADGQLRYTNFEGFSGDKFLATATINLVIPLYDRGQRYADTDLAEARASQAAQALEQERRTARAYLAEARATLVSARSEVEMARAQLKLATEAVKQAEELVKNGLATNLDLADADSRRFAADQLVVQKELDLDLASLRAYYASGGRLIEPVEQK